MARNDLAGASEETLCLTDEETFSKESTDPNGIIDACKRESVLLWTTFLNLIQASHITIITPGELLDPPVLKKLGEGATMNVQEAQWVGRGSIYSKPTAVAVKRLRFELPGMANDLLERPRDEMKHLVNFSMELRAICHGVLRDHTNIVQLLGVTWAEKGLPALVVEKASDSFPTLDKLLERRRLRGVEKAELLAGIADGLGAIHSVFLIHGDLKPANILILESEPNCSLVPKLSDFAFSRSRKESQSSGGTEYWNAPECCELRSGPIGDPRSPLRDHFSLGLVFWNVFRDEIPFHDIGAEGNTTIETRRRIQAAKESGRLLQKLANLKESEKYEAFLLKDANIPETADDDDAILSIVEITEYLLQPKPERRQLKYIHIPSKLRSRGRRAQQSTLVWNGSELTGDIWPGLEDDVQELRSKMEAASMKETKIRLNDSKDFSSAGKSQEVFRSVHSHALQLINDQILLRNSDRPSEVNSMMIASLEATLESNTATDEQKGDAAWALAQCLVSGQPKKAHEYALKAGLSGNEHAQVNYLFRCIRVSFPVAHPPHHQIFADGKWMTIESAAERTSENFRQGIGPIRKGLPPFVLHETAVYGTGDVVRDLLRTHSVDIDRKCQTNYHSGEAAALQVAFLRHNADTVQALVDQGADVLPLFSPKTLELFLIEGNRANLNWLNHLIPLMKEEKNRLQARKMFDSILLSNSGLQRTVVQSNWSPFLAILELSPKARIEEELDQTLLLAVGLRRFEFVLALLVVCSEPSDPQLKNIPLEVERSDSSPYTPLFLALFSDHVSLAETLLYKHQANPLFKTDESETALSIAVYRNNYDSVKLLSGLPSNIWKRLFWTRNFLSEYPIHYAAMKGNPKILKLLWEQPIRQKQFMNQNILHLSADIANKKGFEILFDHIQKNSPAQLKETLEEKDKIGATPLHLFLGSDAHDGTTPKSEALQDRNLWRLLQKILPFVTDINATEDSDLTPLHHVLLFNGDMSDTFTLLLRRGADPLKRSHIGAMPIQVARQAGPNCALATILALAPDPRRDMAKLRQVLETLDGFKASDEMVVKQRLIERRLRFKEIESRCGSL